MEQPLPQLLPQVLDHVKRVQGLQEPLQDGNAGGQLLPARTERNPSPGPAPRREDGAGSRRRHGSHRERRGETGPGRASHRSLVPRRLKSAARCSSLRRARRAAGGTACTASRSARSSSRGASCRAARSSSSTTASAILAPPPSPARSSPHPFLLFSNATPSLRVPFASAAQ